MSSSGSDDQRNVNTEGLPAEPTAKVTSIAEEKPMLRSVAYAPNPSQHLKSAPRPVSAKAGSHAYGKVVPFNKRPHAKPLPKRSNWKVTEDCLDYVPPYYPLEKSCRTIEKSDAEPGEIAARISEALRLLSIAAWYNNEKATAELFTPDHVEIGLHLFKHANGGTIVEVQRVRGCAILYHRHARKILDAAQGLQFSFDGFMASPKSAVASSSAIKAQESITSKENERENALVALEIAGNLLKKDRMDANRLGMESLYLLTDPDKTSLLTAVLTSRVVLNGTTRSCTSDKDDVAGQMGLLNLEDEDSLVASLGIRQTILSLIQRKKLNEEGEEEDYSIDEAHEEYDNDLVNDSEEKCHHERRRESRSFDVDHLDVLHNLALAILANCLDVIAKEGSLVETLQLQAWFGGGGDDCGIDLVRALINVMKKADTHPHDACLSARCLGTLVRASEEAREGARGLDALTVVTRAKDIGRTTHVNLERETECVCETLGSIGFAGISRE